MKRLDLTDREIADLKLALGTRINKLDFKKHHGAIRQLARMEALLEKIDPKDPAVEIIEIKRNIDLVMIRDTDGKIKYRSKRMLSRQQMLDHAAMRQAEGGSQS